MKALICKLAQSLWDHTLLVLGWLILLTGIIMTPLPIPIGLLMVIIGLSLLTWKSHFLRHHLRRLRGRYRGTSDTLKQFTPRLPRWLRRAVELTDPDQRKNR